MSHKNSKNLGFANRRGSKKFFSMMNDDKPKFLRFLLWQMLWQKINPSESPQRDFSYGLDSNTCSDFLPCYLFTLAPAPPMIASTSLTLAIEVSPGVVIANAP